MKVLVELDIDVSPYVLDELIEDELPYGDYYNDSQWCFTIKDSKIVATDKAYVVLPGGQWVMPVSPE